jgi:hypothetical protein
MNIFVIEPFGLFEIEFCSALAATVEENARTSSSNEKISCSVPGFQPSNAKKLITAAGK